MRQKTSFRDGMIWCAVFREHRWIWLLYGIVLAAITVSAIGGVFSRYTGQTDEIIVYSAQAFEYMDVDMHRDVISQMMYAAAVAGLGLSMLLFSHLYSSRASAFLHALPIKRGRLFASRAASGMLMLALALFVAGLGGSAYLALHGVPGNYYAALWQAITEIFCTHAFFFGLGVFALQFTGNPFVHIGLYIVANAMFSMVAVGIDGLATTYLYGVSTDLWSNDVIHLLTPIRYLFNNRWEDFFWNYFLYGLAGVGLLLIAGGLYGRRATEKSGDALVFDWLKTPFRVAFAWGFALVVFISTLSLRVDVWMATRIPRATLGTIWLMLGTLLGYYIAVAISDKTFHIFKGRYKSVIVAAAVMLAVALGLQFDVLGLEDVVPAQEEVAYIMVSDILYDEKGSYSDLGMAARRWSSWSPLAFDTEDMLNGNSYYIDEKIMTREEVDPVEGALTLAFQPYEKGLFDQPENIGQARELHAWLVENRPDEWKAYAAEAKRGLQIFYRYKDGSVLRRDYHYPAEMMTATLPEGPETMYDTLANSLEAREKRLGVYLTEEMHIDEVILTVAKPYSNEEYPHYWAAGSVFPDENKTRIFDPTGLIEALRLDYAEGTVSRVYTAGTDAWFEDMTRYELMVSPTSDDPENPFNKSPAHMGDVYIRLPRSATHTLAWLAEKGFAEPGLDAEKGEYTERDWFNVYAGDR